MRRIEEIRTHSVVIAVAGMEGALFSVLAGLLAAPVIAAPTSVGYGVAAGGRLALRCASCARSGKLLSRRLDSPDFRGVSGFWRTAAIDPGQRDARDLHLS